MKEMIHGSDVCGMNFSVTQFLKIISSKMETMLYMSLIQSKAPVTVTHFLD